MNETWMEELYLKGNTALDLTMIQSKHLWQIWRNVINGTGVAGLAKIKIGKDECHGP